MAAGDNTSTSDRPPVLFGRCRRLGDALFLRLVDAERGALVGYNEKSDDSIRFSSHSDEF